MSDTPSLSTQSGPWHDETFSDLLANAADVFAHRVDDDGAAALLQMCLDITHATEGTMYLNDNAGRLRCVAATDDGTPGSIASPSSTITKALLSLRPEVGFESTKTWIALPLRSRGHAIGAIELITPSISPVRVGTVNAVQSLVDVAASTIEHCRTLEQTSRLVGQLQTALENRVVLEQAKGVLAERLDIDCHAAFHEIRNVARREQKQISEIASVIVAGRHNGITGT